MEGLRKEEHEHRLFASELAIILPFNYVSYNAYNFGAALDNEGPREGGRGYLCNMFNTRLSECQGAEW